MLTVTMSSSGLENGGHSNRISSPESVFLTPPSKQPPLNISGTPVLEDFPQNDDERERRQRRRSRVVDLQLSSTDSPHSVASPSNRKFETSSLLVPKFTNTQIADHYSTCIKLSTENKITTKNAFGLHLIDFMTEILQEKDSELTNFKVAAGTLDASTKIYAVRVDAVHADVYRVLGGLGKSAPAEGADTQEADGSTAIPGTIKKVQKPKKKHQGKTIEQNINNLNVSEADRKYEIDPMFQKTAASFDECSTAGVFLSSLHCSDYRSELLFHSDVRPLSTAEPLKFPDLGSVEVADLKTALMQCVEERQICPSLAEFQFSKWDSDAHTESLSVLVDKFKKSDQVFDVNSEIEDSDSEDCADMPLEDDFDADMHDQTAGGDHHEFKSCQKSSEFQNSRQEVISLGDGDIGTMCLHLSMKPGEYSYFSPRTMSMWAGPDHWCFKPRRKQDPTSQEEKKKKTTKKVYEINFEEEIDFNTHFRKTRAATTLAKSTLDNQSRRATTLPADFHYELENIVQLNLKPGNKLRKATSQSASSEQDDEIEEYDYNNPNDTSEFCPAVPAADSDEDDDGDGPDGLFVGANGTQFDFTINPNIGFGNSQDNENDADVNGLDNPMYGELKLVAEPQKVNKIEIHYAKTAKKMDMKRLKQSMWNLLIDGQEKEAVAENETEPKKNLDIVPDEKIFSDLTKDLLKNLPPLMAQNLSVPLAFACLLHLANEKNLTLKVVEDLSDVLVMQGD
ncbi:condensin complex subunit 2 isoform X1 [Monodelphis domestica]|uniref:Condensin complex subunit 2 n=1 Tax=Monodelphis domestica TaxID=13616 RepID=F7FTE8_MONDO|nr:condensin complex subunit 2 isoform X1 [Monodelphis domestica]XP_007476596.1 condensin complex subunit 2 isoform X1 [Monodelphis domestica]XP_056669717.1 condensin complex subunit 2 isoform X1 [Monodelphis domestica]